MSIKLNINIRSLPNNIEKYIIKNLNKNPPKSYRKISDSELNKVKLMSKNRFPEESTIISDELIKSIRSIYMKNHMINTHIKLKKTVKR